MGLGVPLRQTEEQEAEASDEGTPIDSSVSFTGCPLSYRPRSRGCQRYEGQGPSTQGLRGNYDQPPVSHPPTCQATVLTPLVPAVPHRA